MIGTKIKELRESKKISQSKLAIILNINQSDISKLENGTIKTIDSELLYKISQVFNVTLDSFFDKDYSISISQEKIMALSSEQKTQIILKILDIIEKTI